MALDLLLDLDDGLEKLVLERSAERGMPPEEFVRYALASRIGFPYQSPSETEVSDVRPLVYLDLRTTT